MRFAATYSRAVAGMDAPLVRVEAHITGGLSAFGIVGLPETAVRESRDRVRSGILSAGFRFPDSRLTVNLAPADLPKAGGRFDLAIAVAVLAASGQVVTEKLEACEFLAELGLEGSLRPVRGALLAAHAAGQAGRALLVATANGPESALAPGSRARTADQLLDVSTFLAGVNQLPEPTGTPARDGEPRPSVLASIRGQAAPKRALLVAAAGGHNLLMQGPPGTGKTLLARSLPELLPELDHDETMEVAALHSLAGLLAGGGLPERPFRSPHHSASAAALLGGGNPPAPGEMSLAHQGVLFLDELPEFSRQVLESLREPLECGEVAIARARARAVYPARFQLIAAMNPCPAGYDCRGGVSCQCSPGARQRYQTRISGPLLDRIDLHVQVPPVPISVLAEAADPATKPDRHAAPDPARTTAAEVQRWRAQVAAARQLARQRQGCLNAHLTAAGTDHHCRPDAAAMQLLESAAERLQLSARGWHRTLRVARTLADLGAGADPAPEMTSEHIAEALAYREHGLHGNTPASA